MIPEYERLNWIVVHGRGVLNTSHGEVFARTLASAGTISNRESFYYMRYDDSPERDNIPLMFYTVIGNPKIDITLHEEVEPVGEIFDALVLMEPTLLINQTSQRALLFDGAKKDATLIVNTSLSPNEIVKLVKKYALGQDWEGKLVTIRARNYDVNIAYPLLAALAKASDIVSLEELIDALDFAGASNKIDVVKKAYNEVSPVAVRVAASITQARRVGKKAKPPLEIKEWTRNRETYKRHQRAAGEALSYTERISAMPRWEELPPGLIEFGPLPGEKNVGFKTAFARYLRPLVDEKKCTKCRTCSLFCPDGCIDAASIKVDLDYCKGCGVCSEVCPVKAITMVSELYAKEGLKEIDNVSIEDALIEYGY